MAVGFDSSQQTGFRLRDQSLDVHGSLREVPSVSAYATSQNLGVLGAGLSVGARSGLVVLHSVKAYDVNDSVATAGGSAFQAGPVLGLAWSRDKGNTWFIEGSYLWRQFAGVDWTGDVVKGRVPKMYPRTFNLSGASIQAGVQIRTLR